jgi:sulfotransferase
MLEKLNEPAHMTKRFYFMAGLPRSGSTLLSAILNQNPEIHSGPSSPVVSTMHVLESHFKKEELYNAFPKKPQADQIISNVITQYYSDIDKPVVIDKNRAWVAQVPYIENYIGQRAKIICPVRDVDEILTSMISMIRRNAQSAGTTGSNFIDQQLGRLNLSINDENRCNFIASPNGILGMSLKAIHDGAAAGYLDRMLFVEYRDLVSDPESCMRRIYGFLDEPKFKHDFGNLENTFRENDQGVYGLGDMHEVRRQLAAIAPAPKDVLPASVIARCRGMDLWRHPEALQAVRP